MEWLTDATELEQLAVAAKKAIWTREQALRALELTPAITRSMLGESPPVEPPPVDPPPVDPPPPTGDHNRPKHPPTTGPVKNATPATLGTVYANAAAGDQIVLKSGDYGAINLNRSFDPDRPVIIRSENTLGAVFTGTITVAGTGHWLHEIKTQQPALASRAIGVLMLSPHLHITRCWINSADGCKTVTQNDKRWQNMHHLWIGWCRFTGQNNTTSRFDHIYVTLPDEGRWTTNTNGPHHVYVYRNFFWDNLSKGKEDHSVYIGDSKRQEGDVHRAWEVVFAENFWHVQMKRTRVLYLKAPCEVLYNHADCAGYNFSTRHGVSGKWWGNRSKCTGMEFAGQRRRVDYKPGLPWGTADEGHHHDIRGNVFTGPFRLLTGATPSLTDIEPPYQAAHFALLVGNEITKGVYVGFRYSGYVVNQKEGGEIDGVKIYRCGKPLDVKVQTCRTQPKIIDGDGDYSYPGDGTVRGPANYALNGSEQGLEGPGQASAT